MLGFHGQLTILETGPELLVLDSRDLADPAVVNSVRRIEALGSEQYEMFKERLIECTTAISTLSLKTDFHYLDRHLQRCSQSTSFNLLH